MTAEKMACILKGCVIEVPPFLTLTDGMTFECQRCQTMWMYYGTAFWLFDVGFDAKMMETFTIGKEVV